MIIVEELINNELLNIELVYEILNLKKNMTLKEARDIDLTTFVNDKNICEFVFVKCKNWASKNDYVICSYVEVIETESYIYSSGYAKVNQNIEGGCEYESSEKTELEAILKACDWILHKILSGL